eukprot:625633-Karenia_brevis.AAC.1
MKDLMMMDVMMARDRTMLDVMMMDVMMDVMMMDVMMDMMMGMMMMDVMRSHSGNMLPKSAGAKQRPPGHAGRHTRDSQKKAIEKSLQENLAKRADDLD